MTDLNILFKRGVLRKLINDLSEIQFSDGTSKFEDGKYYLLEKKEWQEININSFSEEKLNEEIKELRKYKIGTIID